MEGGPEMTPENPARSAKTWRQRLRRAALILGVVVIVLFAFPGFFLRVHHDPAPCDAIVLLGGATGERDPLAADLYRRGISRLVVVTGRGDCLDNVRGLVTRGVPTNAIVFECEARTTQENAVFAARILRERHCTNITLVTSWYHSRRSLATFRRFAPDLKARCAVVERPLTLRYQVPYIAAEYVKTVIYAFRWGIWPWSLPGTF